MKKDRVVTANHFQTKVLLISTLAKCQLLNSIAVKINICIKNSGRIFNLANSSPFFLLLIFLFGLFLGPFPELVTPNSVLRNYSEQYSVDHIGCQRTLVNHV